MEHSFGIYMGWDVEVIDRMIICEGKSYEYEIAKIRTTSGHQFEYEVGGPDDGPSYTTASDTLWVRSDLIQNYTTEQIPDDLPIAAAPAGDDPETLAALDWSRQVNDLQTTGRGA